MVGVFAGLRLFHALAQEVVRGVVGFEAMWITECLWVLVFRLALRLERRGRLLHRVYGLKQLMNNGSFYWPSVDESVHATSQ